VSPCGLPGDACCDGPETRALGWNSYGVYSPTGPFLKEMCVDGTCDKPSHRCVACASGPGTACCPPDASQATARCIGPNLECKFDDNSYSSGTCFVCGVINSPPCNGYCDSPWKLSNGICVECGDANKVACDATEYWCNNGCKPHLLVVDGICTPCGDVGQIQCGYHDTSSRLCGQYVDWNFCKPGLGVLHGLCQMCGSEGKSPCDNGCFWGLKTKQGLCTTFCGHENQEPCDDGSCYAPLQVIQGMCKMCGLQAMSPCPQGGCRYPLKIRQGLCTNCGSQEMPPCDTGCDPGSLIRQGLCSSTCGKGGYPPCDSGCRDGQVVSPQGICIDPTACAREGEACVTGSFGTAGTGLLCCVQGGPFICEWGFCRQCIPHGAEVPLHGTQRCCSPDDFVVADGAGGQKCDIPDTPG
jgi:hypothetical protein